MREDPIVTLARAIEKAQEQGIEVNERTLSLLISNKLGTTIDITRFGDTVTVSVARHDAGVAIAVGTRAVENNFSALFHACLDVYADSLAEKRNTIEL